MAKGDLISRKRLLDELRAELKECKKDAAEYGGESILWAEGLEFAIDTVKQTAIDAVEVVHGRWEIAMDDYGCELMRCSCCGSEFYDGDNDTVDHLYNYCPNCGAKMDGGNYGEL